MNANEIMQTLREQAAEYDRRGYSGEASERYEIIELIESLQAQRDSAVAGEKSVLARFRHLLKSDFIAAFDEWDPHKNDYALDIGEADEIATSLEAYSAAARSIAVSLKDYCDRSLPYDQMIADAARKAAGEIEALRAENVAGKEANESCHGYIKTLQSRLAESQRRERAYVTAIHRHYAERTSECFLCYSCVNREARFGWDRKSPYACSGCGDGHPVWRFDIDRFSPQQAGEESREMNKVKDGIE